jgi:glutamate dehydrogenase/leucine dehydrogenase
VQDLGRLFWGRDEIRAKLAEKLGDAFDRVWQLSERQDISLRGASLVVAIREVAAALEARGIYP